MVVTELVSQLPMGWLKALAFYSTATGGWPRGVSVNASRGRATEKKEWGGPRTWNMFLMSVTELVSQLPMGWLKALAFYSTATGGWPRGVSVNASRGRATEKKEWGGPRTIEHVAHIGHRARDPVTDVLVEVTGILQHSDGRVAARSERQCVEGAGDGEKGMGRTTYLEHVLMVVTELVSQLPMGWLKALAFYITATGGWPRGVSVNASRGRATEKK